jgi:vitamin B12 transporter
MPRLLEALCVSLVSISTAKAQAPPKSSSQPSRPPASQPVLTELWIDETVVLAPSVEPAQEPIGGDSFVVTPELRWGSQSNAAELLKKIPGVTVRSAGGDGQRQVVLLRGASEEQVLVLLDGVRLNEASGGGVDLSEIPAGSIARIEVVTGSAAALYGAEAMGGVILLLTRSAYERSEAEVSTSLSSFSTLRANAARLDQFGSWGVFAQVNALESSGKFTFTDTNDRPRERQNNDAQQLSGLIKAERVLGEAWSLSLIGKASLSQRGIPGPEQFESLSAHQEVKRLFLAAQLNGKELSPGLEYRFMASLRAGDTFFEDPTPQLGRPFEAAATEFSPSMGWRFLWRPPEALTLVGPLASLPSPNMFGEGGPTALPLVGEALLLSEAPRLSLLGGDFSWSYEEMNSEEISTGESHRIRGSMALFSELSWGALRVAPALRLEGSSTFGVAPVPRLGLSYQLGESLQLKASAGRSYRAPSLRDLFLRVDGISGNPDLSPEDAWEVSSGFSLERRGVALSANLFAREARNIILFVQESAFEVKAQNFEGYTTKGAELHSVLHWKRLVLEGNYTHLNTQGENGLSLPGVPTDKVVGRLTWKEDRWQAFSALETQTTFFTNLHNTQLSPRRELLSVGVSTSLAERVEISLEGQNLLNQTNLVDALQLPLPPRVFTLTLRGIF